MHRMREEVQGGPPTHQLACGGVALDAATAATGPRPAAAHSSGCLQTSCIGGERSMPMSPPASTAVRAGVSNPSILVSHGR